MASNKSYIHFYTIVRYKLLFFLLFQLEIYSIETLIVIIYKFL